MTNQPLTYHLLPTEDASLFFRNKELVYFPSLCLHSKGLDIEGEMILPQHLYLCSNRIKEGINWYYNTELKVKGVFQCTKSDKIIAGEKILFIEFTTDPKLWDIKQIDGVNYGVPAIDGNTKAIVTIKKNYREVGKESTFQDVEVNFLSEFCKRYNQKDNQKVDVEKVFRKVFVKERLPNYPEKYLTDWGWLDYEPSCINDAGTYWSEENEPRSISRNPDWWLEEIALQNAGGFSLEDMKVAIKTTMVNYKITNSIDTESHINELLQYTLQSLTKEQPKGGIVIECEMETVIDSGAYPNGEPFIQQIKLTNGQPTLIFK